MPTLSSILVQRGVATMRAVEDAIARQVLHGGDLPTNLLELGSVDEAMLTAILAECFGLDAAPSGKLHAPSPTVSRLIPVDLAHRHSIFPIAQPGRQLILAAAEPLTAAVRDDLGFALDLEIITRIALLVRVRQALAEHYQITLDRRFQRLVTKLAGARKPELAPPPPDTSEGFRVRPPQAISVPAPSFGTGVSSTPSAFHEAPTLEAHAALVRPSRGRLEDVAALETPIKAALASPPLPVIEGAPGTAFGHDDITPPAEASQEGPPPAVASQAARAPAVAQALAGWVQHEIKNERVTAVLLDKHQPRPAVRPVRRKGPFTAAMAEEELEAAETSDAVLDVVFAFAAQFFEYCALFVIQGELAEGRDAAGPGAGRERLMALGVPLDLPSSFERLRRHRAPRVGPLDASGLDAEVLRDLGRDGARAGRAVALLPILIRTRAVAILFGDDGDTDVTLPALGDVIVFAALAARALERILVRKKLGSRAPDMPLRPPSGAPDAPPALKTPLRPAAVSIARMRALVEPPGARERAPAAPVTGPSATAATPKNEGDFLPPPDLIVPYFPPRDAAPARESTPPEDPEDRARDTIDWSRVARAQVAIAAAPDGDLDLHAERGDRTTWVGMAPGEDDEDDHAHLPMGERPTYRKLRVPHQADEGAENRGRRGPAPALEGRAAALPPPPPLAPMPRTPPSNATAWTTFPSQRPAPLSLLRRPPTSDRPIPREDIDSSPGVSFIPALDPSPISPSLTSDVGAEYVALIQRVIDGGPGSQEAFDELVRHGEHALQALMAKFPGPLRVDRHRARDQLPAASQCGPILEILVTIRRPALPFVSGRASSMDTEIRFWATHLLGELRYPEAATVLIPRLFDEDAGVRRIARRSASALVAAGAAGEPILLGLDNITRNPDHPSSHRILAIETIAEIRSGAMVPALIAVLEGRAEDVADAARRALTIITRQDHARDVSRWHEWLARNVARHRIEWLIDALMHEQPSLRRAAGDELKLITKEYFGYYDDLPKKERERAQTLYRTWWEREGKPRFS